MDGTVAHRVSTRLSFEFALLLGVGAVIAICAVALHTVGVAVRPASFVNNWIFYAVCWFALEGSLFLVALARERPESPFRFAVPYFKARREPAARGLPIIAALGAFMPVFSTMKSSIPLFAEYTWDSTFIDADRAIFGQDAWLLLQPSLGFPVVTSAISVAYHLWILLIFFGGLYFAIYRRDAVSRQFFVAYFAIWTIIGIAMATGFASVGPCFVGPILGLDTFDAQMAYLAAANERFPVMVLDVQSQLLEWHRSGQHGLGRGISAMPSMHVALAFLFWLALRKSKAGWPCFAFYVAIFVGSVHLGYHYAVDGIVSTVATWLIWIVTRRISWLQEVGSGGLERPSSWRS